MPVIFKLPEKPLISREKLLLALNKVLPSTIYVRNISEINDDFDPRFDALGKAYTYVLTQKDPGPFTSNWCWQVPFKFDLDKLFIASKYVVGKHDFSSFAVAINKTKKNPIRNIFRIDINSFDSFTCVTFIGESFLYKMVRSLIGSIVSCSQKNIEPESIKNILNAKDRSVAYKTAPANGLFLVKVFYEIEECRNFKLKDLPFLL